MNIHNESPKEKVYNLVIGSLAIKDSECNNIDMLIFKTLNTESYTSEFLKKSKAYISL